MGLFDKLKKKEQLTNVPQTMKEEYNVELISMQNKGQIKHRNNEKTDLYIARMSRAEDTIIFSMADYVAFEMPEGKQIDEQIEDLIKRRYSRESYGKYSNNNKYYFGRLQQIGQELYFGNKSEAVESFVEQLVDKDIEAKKEKDRIKSEEYLKEQEKIREQEDFKARIRGEEYLKEVEKTRQERKANPQLKRNGMEYKDENGKSHYNYEGVNINTGEILRISNTLKIGKDNDGTYLYSAQIYNTENDYDADMIGSGYNVCFELYKNLESILQSNNREEIIKVLELLSDKNNFQDKNTLKYIGKLDSNGQITRENTSRSIPIAEEISKMQQEFEKMKSQKQGER